MDCLLLNSTSVTPIPNVQKYLMNTLPANSGLKKTNTYKTIISHQGKFLSLNLNL